LLRKYIQIRNSLDFYTVKGSGGGERRAAPLEN